MSARLTFHNPAYEFEGYFKSFAFCDLQIGRKEDGAHLVMFTEIPENVGTSITNRSEHLATTVCKEFQLDPTKTVFIEHYPLRGQFKESYALVTYTWQGATAKGAQWKYIPLEDATTLLEAYGLKKREREERV